MKPFYQHPEQQYHQQLILSLNRPSDYQLAQLGSSSQYPDQIIDRIKKIKDNVNGIVLTNVDVWRYSDSKELQDWIASDNRDYFIATCGYQNQQIIPRMYELSMPFWYYFRSIVPAQLKAHDLTHGFACLNNRVNLPRLALGCSLNNQQLIDQLIFSQNTDGLPLGGYSQVLLEQLSSIQEYLKQLPIVWANDNLPSGGDGVDRVLNHQAFDLAYCNIVVETETENFMKDCIFPTPVITEKSFRPFMSCQIPIWLAAQGQIQYLTELGFETMEDLLPLGYDAMNTFDKISAITDLVAKGQDYIKDYYFSHVKEIMHNYELVSSDCVERLISKRIKDFLG